MRYPLAALVAASGLTEAQLARRVGLSGSTLKMARERGLVERSADRYAVRAGLHPFEVWPEMADEHLADLERVEAERLERRRQIARESARRRYHEDPEVRAKRIEAAAAWRATNSRALQFQPSRQPEARREQSRTYYQRHAERLRAEARERHRRTSKENAA